MTASIVTWSPAERQRLARMVAAMRPLRSILLEFGEHDPAIVRLTLDDILSPAPASAERALAILVGRANAVRCPPGFRLDGRPCVLLDLVREATKVLVTYGRPPMRYPGL